MKYLKGIIWFLAYGLYFQIGPSKERKGNFSVWHLHHFWTGVVIAAVGFYLIFNSFLFLSAKIGFLTVMFGLYLAFDDAWQHYEQSQQIDRVGKYNIYSLMNWLPERFLNIFRSKDKKVVYRMSVVEDITSWK